MLYFHNHSYVKRNTSSTFYFCLEKTAVSQSFRLLPVHSPQWSTVYYHSTNNTGLSNNSLIQLGLNSQQNHIPYHDYMDFLSIQLLNIPSCFIARISKHIIVKTNNFTCIPLGIPAVMHCRPSISMVSFSLIPPRYKIFCIILLLPYVSSLGL